MRTAAESAVVAVRRGRFNEAREAIAFLSGRRLRMEGSGETRTVRAGSRPADQTCTAVTPAAYALVSDLAMMTALVACMAKKLQVRLRAHSLQLPGICLNRRRKARPGDRAPLTVSASPPFLRDRPFDNVTYVRVRGKFALAITLSLAWLIFTIWIAMPWMRDLARLSNWPIALLVIGGIALVPGLMNPFLAASLLLARRPLRRSWNGSPA